MWTISDLLCNFFTHKDFLPSADRIPGTMFTPLHFVFSAVCIALVVGLCLNCRKKAHNRLRTVFAVLWGTVVLLEILKILWESCAGTEVQIEWRGVLPLYPCSIFMYAMPFAVWGQGFIRRAACGYVCTLGLVGGTVNFVYPATILGNYSCLSFAGFHTFFYHGAIVFCALTMLLSGYHTYTGIRQFRELLLPSLPFLSVSLLANAVNFSIGADYMFFRLNSFIFTPLGKALPDVPGVFLVYAAYIIIHALPYLPSYFYGCRKKQISDSLILTKARSPYEYPPHQAPHRRSDHRF